eukprot:scaffold1747_cov108-Isochrysis_galbana.AAC.13
MAGATAGPSKGQGAVRSVTGGSSRRSTALSDPAADRRPLPAAAAAAPHPRAASGLAPPPCRLRRRCRVYSTVRIAPHAARARPGMLSSPPARLSPTSSQARPRRHPRTHLPSPSPCLLGQRLPLRRPLHRPCRPLRCELAGRVLPAAALSA